MMTASASAAKLSGFCRRTETPFIDVTSTSGEVMYAIHPFPCSRFRIAAATNESSSLKPSKVKTAICMTSPLSLRRQNVEHTLRRPPKLGTLLRHDNRPVDQDRMRDHGLDDLCIAEFRIVELELGVRRL